MTLDNMDPFATHWTAFLTPSAPLTTSSCYTCVTSQEAKERATWNNLPNKETLKSLMHSWSLVSVPPLHSTWLPISRILPSFQIHSTWPNHLWLSLRKSDQPLKTDYDVTEWVRIQTRSGTSVNRLSVGQDGAKRNQEGSGSTLVAIEELFID